MNKLKNYNSSNNTASDPSSPNYAKNVKNKANQKSPSAEDEPSTKTTYK
ncbi:hypothetical protein KPL40_05435 [Clostridium gasigenes]|nr:hypothetical protein [Clostridium gasigenes]MBU3131888.1 hypothetical protein [Clostridium gasigenes]